MRSTGAVSHTGPSSQHPHHRGHEEGNGGSRVGRTCGRCSRVEPACGISRPECGAGGRARVRQGRPRGPRCQGSLSLAARTNANHEVIPWVSGAVRCWAIIGNSKPFNGTCGTNSEGNGSDEKAARNPRSHRNRPGGRDCPRLLGGYPFLSRPTVTQYEDVSGVVDYRGRASVERWGC